LAYQSIKNETLHVPAFEIENGRKQNLQYLWLMEQEKWD